MLGKILLTLILLSPQFVLSGVNSYQCLVLSNASIEDSGYIKILPKSLHIGQKFAVDRKTGVLIGDIFVSFGEPKVIARGSKDNSFKVIWLKEAGGKDGMFLDYLSIDEFKSGAKKSFSYFTGGLLFAGVCE